MLAGSILFFILSVSMGLRGLDTTEDLIRCYGLSIICAVFLVGATLEKAIERLKDE